jgi:hypothetical protein
MPASPIPRANKMFSFFDNRMEFRDERKEY